MDKKNRKIIILLFTVGWVFRLIFFLYFDPIYAGDTPSYMGIVDNILRGQFYPDIDNAFRLPGYPLFISFLLFLSGGKTSSVIIVQQIISSSVAVLIYLTTLRIFNPEIAQLSGWLVALNPALAYFSTIILSETIVVALAACALLFVIYAINLNRNKWFLFCGMSLALLTLFNPVGTLLGLIFSGICLFYREIKHKWVKAVFVILPVFLVYSAWIGHNYIKFGETDFAPTYGYNLLERTIYLRAPEIDSQVFNSAYLKFTSHKANETYGDQKDEMYWWHSVMETAGELKRNENIFEVNRLFLFTALELIKSDPLGYIWSSIGEFGYIWAGYTTHSYKWRPAGGGKLADWSFLILGLVLGFIMFLLVTMGILDNLYRKNWLSLYLILPIIFITGFYALVSVTGYRYRLVVEPYILVVIGYSIINFKRGLWPIKKFFEI